jgi:hypothetical protein
MQLKQEEKGTITTANSAPAAMITRGTTGIGTAARAINKEGFTDIATGAGPDTIAAAERNLPKNVVMIHADLRALRTFDFIRVRKGIITYTEEA